MSKVLELLFDYAEALFPGDGDSQQTLIEHVSSGRMEAPSLEEMECVILLDSFRKLRASVCAQPEELEGGPADLVPAFPPLRVV